MIIAILALTVSSASNNPIPPAASFAVLPDVVFFVLKLPVVVIYALINIDEIVKLPAVYIHYKKYKWLNNLTRKEEIVSA